MKLRENVLISELTTMRLGGEARYVAEVSSLADVKEAYEFARDEKLPVFILGSGSNTIGRDEGFPGLLILNRLTGMEVVEETSDDVLVRAVGGEIWDDFVGFCVERGYSGIEAMSAIPGTVGAAPVQNIGAYGQEIAQTIDNVEAYDTKTGEMVILGRDEMKMNYRSTIFNTGADAGRYFITAVTLRLENDEHLEPPFYTSLQKYLDEHQISDYSPSTIRAAVSAIRAEKLPDPAVEASAGSFFKNIHLPDEEAQTAREKGLEIFDKPNGTHVLNAGWLIEEAGLKGRELPGGFHISDKAALILINDNAKSYEDLEAARAEIIRTVFDKFGFSLEQEPVELVASAHFQKGRRA